MYHVMKLHSYQETARAHLLRHPRAALFLDMGMGKTATVLSALTEDHLPALVVAPKRVAENVWPTEADLWRPDLYYRVAAGSPAARRDALSDADLVVIGRDNLRDVTTTRFRTLVLDELSSFKNRDSARFKAASRIASSSAHVWGLTGTPSPNGLIDLWAQVAVLDGGERLGRNITTFRRRYFRPGRQLRSGIVTEWLLLPGADRAIYDAIGDICLSMEPQLEQMPVTYNTIRFDLPKPARRAYDEMTAQLVTDLELLGGEIHSAVNAAALTNKLSQITAGFIYSDDPTRAPDALHSAKIDAVEEVVDGTGSPVLVFYRYRAEADALRARFRDAHDITSAGAIPRWNAGEIPILLAHPASAGHGLNLQHGGHTVVWTSLPWELELWKQGNARVARQGQKHPVVVHTIAAKGSIDGAIAARLESKGSVQDALLAALEVSLCLT